MSVLISGDFDKLRLLVAQMGKLASGEFAKQFRADAAVCISQLVHAGFAQSRSPYGRPWAASRGHGDLIESGRLQGSLVIKATSEGVSVTSNVPYAAVHQYGSRTRGRGRIPARPYLPDRDTWPPLWWKALEATADLAMEHHWEWL